MALRDNFEVPPRILSGAAGILYSGTDGIQKPVGNLPAPSAGGGEVPLRNTDGTVDWAVPTAAAPDPPFYTRRQCRYYKLGSSSAFLAEGVAAPTQVADTITSVDDTEGQFLRVRTSTTSGNTAGWSTGGIGVQPGWDVDWVAVMRTGALTNVGYWVGFWLSTATMDASATPATSYMAFRFWSTVDSGFWATGTRDLTTATTTTTTTAIAASTRYVLRIKYDSTVPSATFYVDGLAVATHTTNLPLSGSGYNWGLRVSTLTTAAASVDLNRIEFTHI